MKSGGRLRLRKIFSSQDAILETKDQTFQIVSVLPSPCRVACPAAVNVKAYVRLIAARKFDQALEVVRQKNPFPGICGRVCTHPCEEECRRKAIDEPVAIRALKRFIADYALDKLQARLPKEMVKREQRVAVVGAGPAGLTAANDLARWGYQVTIFEAQEKPGGMLLWGIPPFRLPQDVIEQEIDSILSLGIEILTRTKIDDPAELLKEGYQAVFYAPGCQRSVKLGLPRENELFGVIDALAFLHKAYQGELKCLSGRVVVVGGGNSAIDAARVAKRLGAQEVWVVYRRTKREMPAGEEEISEAEAENIRIEFLTQPVELVYHGGKVTGLKCVRTTLGVLAASGRKAPVPIGGTEFVISADWVITTLGQKVERVFGHLPDGVFVGGDAAGGPATVIDAIAGGHAGAEAIHESINGKQNVPSGAEIQLELNRPVLTAVPLGQVRSKRLPPERRDGFAEIEEALKPEEVVLEAERCLRCGSCGECVRCHRTCPKNQVAICPLDGSEGVLLRIHAPESAFPEGLEELPVTIKYSGEQGEETIPGVIHFLVVKIEKELCRGCGRCGEVCPHEALVLEEWRPGVQTAMIEGNRRRGCGNCLVVYPSGALQGAIKFQPWVLCHQR